MKENNQKIQKKSWGIIIAVLSVCIIATAFFDYVNINLAGKIPILDKILEFAGISEEYLKISPSELIAHTSSAQDILLENWELTGAQRSGNLQYFCFSLMFLRSFRQFLDFLKKHLRKLYQQYPHFWGL